MTTISPSSTGTDIERMKTYIYSLNFQCLANSIEEADACFLSETQLSFGKKHQPATLCTNISVQVLSPPKHPEMQEAGRAQPASIEKAQDEHELFAINYAEWAHGVKENHDRRPTFEEQNSYTDGWNDAIRAALQRNGGK